MTSKMEDNLKNGRQPKKLEQQPPRPNKSRDPRDRRSQPQSHIWCHILVRWDLFFGACHFSSFKTVHLAKKFRKTQSKLSSFVFLTHLHVVFFYLTATKNTSFFGFVTKFVKFYVVDHAFLVPHFDSQKT